MPTARRRCLPAILLAGLAPLPLSAQGERVRIRVVPAPHQIIRIESSQDMAFDAVVEGMGLDALKLVGKTRFAGTMKTSAPDALGRVTTEFTYEDASLDMTSNGGPIPIPNAMAQLKGKTVVVIYDRDGKLASVRMPEELGGDSGSVKTMLQGISASIPDTTLRIGETISVPATMAIPIPMGGGASGEPMNLESRTTMKLVAVRREGGNRIAVLDQVLSGRMSYSIPGSAGATGAMLEMRMTGTGKTEVNLDQRFVTSSTSDSNLDMLIVMQTPNGSMSMKLTGTVKMLMTGVSRSEH